MNSAHSVLSIIIVLSLYGTVQGLHPVILVPGDGGSQLEAKLDKKSVVHYICQKKTDDFFNIWLNMEELVPVIIDCWIDNVRLVYNFSTRKTENSPGVEIRVPGFGNTSTVEYLDPSTGTPGLYFNNIVDQSLLPLGYKRNENIRGAPYDFRKAPNEMGEWMVDFRNLVEETYLNGGKTSVILISHSMGGPLALYFLQKMSQKWKDKYIRALITLASPWGGSVKAWKVFAAGDDLGVYVLPGHTLRGMQRTSPSTAFLLPSTQFWDKDEVIVSCKGKGNYTVNDYQRFFKDMNYPEGYEMRRDTEHLLTSEPPRVELHCLHGQGVSTVESMVYKDEKYFPDKPSLNWGNGDGTVNIRSLRGCLRWSPKSSLRLNKPIKRRKTRLEQSEPVYHQEYSGVDHMQILRDAGVINYVKDTVNRINGDTYKII